MLVFAFQGIIAKDHEADGNGGENGDNDDPDDGVVDVFLSGRVNVGDGTLNQEIDDHRAQQQPNNAK